MPSPDRRPPILLALLVWLCAACGGNGGGAPLAGYNLILINIDALRADHLGLSGYPRRSSPFLDELSRQAVVFERASANSSYTRESVATLLTGRLPSRGGHIGWYAHPSPETPTLGEWLQRAGFATGFLSNTVMLRQPSFTRGFDEVAHLPRKWNLSGEGSRLSAAALDFALRHRGERFALYLHYLDPHAPYAPEAKWLSQLGASPVAAPLGLYDDVTARFTQLREEGLAPGDPRFEDLRDRYDAEIAATDAALRQLFTGLEALGLAEKSLVVVTADHGEEFLEHGYVEHGWTLYAESLHVPLLFWVKRGLPASRVPLPVSQVDILPTLAQLLGLELEGAELDGEALFELRDGSLRALREPRPVIAELLIARRNVLRSLTRDGWSYIAFHSWVPPEDRGAADRAGVGSSADLWSPPLREELYDLSADPRQLSDVADREPERLEALRTEMERFRGGAQQPAQSPGAPSLDEEERQRLRALGYGA